MILYGWTLHQYAIAKAHHKRLTETEIEANIDGALLVKEWWEMRRNDKPGEIKLIAVDPFLDLAWASKMFYVGMLDCPVMRP